MPKESAEEIRWSKEVRRQQQVVDQSHDPREQSYLDRLIEALERAKTERKAKSAEARRQPKESDLEQPSTSTRPINREARVIKARERVEQVQQRVNEAQAAAESVNKQVGEKLDSLEQETPNAIKRVADEKQALQRAIEQLEKAEQSVRSAQVKVQQRKEQEAAEAAKVGQQKNTDTEIKLEHGSDVLDLGQESETGNSVLENSDQHTTLVGSNFSLSQVPLPATPLSSPLPASSSVVTLSTFPDSPLTASASLSKPSTQKRKREEEEDRFVNIENVVQRLKDVWQTRIAETAEAQRVAEETLRVAQEAVRVAHVARAAEVDTKASEAVAKQLYHEKWEEHYELLREERRKR